MFNNLVESASHGDEFKRRGSFFAGALGVYALLFTAIGIGSVFAYDAHLEKQQLELVSLLTPIEAPAAEQNQRPAPRHAANTPKDQAQMATRTSTPPSPDPTKTNNAIAASTTQPPPVLNNTGYTIGDKNTEGVPRSIGIIGPPGPTDNDNKKFSDDTPPPPRRDDSRNTEQKRSIVVSKGVVTGMATALPQPIYPRIALQSGVFGTVTVQVLIDEDGKVISAKAVSGHPLLLSAAVTAAYRARFTPTRLSEVPVKVSGVINYNFQKQ